MLVTGSKTLSLFMSSNQLLSPNMPLLTVNYSEPLVSLVKEGFDSFDGVSRLAPGFAPEQIAGFRQEYSQACRSISMPAV